MSRYGGGGGGGRTAFGQSVVLHVYDLSPANDFLGGVGIGAYHSGLEVAGEEYTFAAQAGIFTHGPKQAPGVRLRESIQLGTFEGGPITLRGIVEDLKKDFSGSHYNIVRCNCNHFADALARTLVGRGIPDYVNRLAWFGSFVSCLVPDEASGQAPVDQSSQPLLGGDRAGGRVINQGSGVTRRTPSTQSSAFAGQGYSLSGGGNGGGGSTARASTGSGGGGGGGGGAGGLSAAERRERVRMATMKRMGQSS